MNNKGETTFKIIIAILGAILCGLVAVCVCVVIPGRIRERRPQQVTDSSAAEESPQKENPDSEEVRKADSGSKELEGTGNKNTSDGKTENPDVKTEKTEKDNPGKKTPEEKQDSPKEDDSDEKTRKESRKAGNRTIRMMALQRQESRIVRRKRIPEEKRRRQQKQSYCPKRIQPSIRHTVLSLTLLKMNMAL